MSYLSFLVDGKIIRFNRDIVYRWEFLIDFLEQFPDEEEIPWTYSSTKEMLEWKNLNDNLDQEVEVDELLPLSKVWKTINFMRPTEKSYLKYYWIDPLVPERDRLLLHREQGRRLREDSTSMEFISLAQSKDLKECIHNNMYLYYDPLAQSSQFSTGISEYKERLLNIDFINIASSLMYEARKRLGHSKLPEHRRLVNVERDYLSDLDALKNEPLLRISVGHQMAMLKKERFEIPFDLISWEDAWLMIDNKWFYLSRAQMYTRGEIASFCDFLEEIDNNYDSYITRWDHYQHWRPLYLALAGRDIDVAPYKDTPHPYLSSRNEISQSPVTPLDTETFVISDKMKTYSSNIAALYDKLLPAMCQVAPNAEYLGIERFVKSLQHTPYISKGELSSINAWGLIAMINYQCIAAAMGNSAARVKPKDMKKVVKYLLNHIGGRACVLMCERSITLAEMGESASMKFCEEVLDQAANRQNEGFIKLPSY
jgi:hypothetical protein